MKIFKEIVTKNKEYFQVDPVLDGEKIERELDTQGFLNKNIKYDNQGNHNTEYLYDMLDRVDRKVDKTEHYLDAYNPIFCRNNYRQLMRYINKYEANMECNRTIHEQSES